MYILKDPSFLLSNHIRAPRYEEIEFALLDEDRITLSQRRIYLSQRRVLVILGMYSMISPKFRIQQYLQNEHYALWEVIEFGDSYKAPQEKATSESSAKKKGRTVVITTKDMQKRRNDVKARTTLLLALPNEHQLRFSKYETAKNYGRDDLDTMSLDYVYNHLKVYEPEV
nr:hypothetical protein [Tanacetum cinerariifolium]